MSITSLTLHAKNRDSVQAVWDLIDATRLPNVRYLQVEMDMKELYSLEESLLHLPLEGYQNTNLHNLPQLQRLLVRCEDWPIEYPSVEELQSILEIAPLLDECKACGILAVEHSVLRQPSEQPPVGDIEFNELFASCDTKE
jgi:hypothetical protein